MSDWQKGDLALCVADRPYEPQARATGLRRGAIYEVKAVGRTLTGHLGIVLRGFDWTGTFQGPVLGAWRFRKIRPHTPDAEDIRTIALLNGEPVREGVEG